MEMLKEHPLQTFSYMKNENNSSQNFVYGDSEIFIN